MEEEDKLRDNAALNLSAALVLQLANLLEQASSAYIKGDPHSCFIYLKACRNRFIYTLNKNERASLYKAEGPLYDSIGKHAHALNKMRDAGFQRGVF